MRYEVEVQGRRRQVQVTRTNGRFTVDVDGHAWSVDAIRVDDHTLSLLMTGAAEVELARTGGRSQEIMVATNPLGTLTARIEGVAVEVNPHTRARRGRGGEHGSAGGPQRLVAPMAGKVVRVLVKPGDTVVARQPVVVVEAMKMENELRASRDGRVTDVAVRDGQSVEAGALLAVIADS